MVHAKGNYRTTYTQRYDFFENSASEENFSMFYEYFEKSRYGTVRTIGLENYDKSRGIRYGTGQVLQIPSRAQPWKSSHGMVGSFPNFEG